VNSIFFKSVLVQPPVILGVQLKPFSPYHALTMAQFDNAFVTGRDIEVHDIVQAVMICRDEYEDKCFHLEKFHCSALYRFWWTVRLYFLDVDQALKDLLAHTKTYTTYPSVWRESGKKTHSGIPWQFKVVAQLLSNYSFSERAAWNMGVDRAFCYLANISENSGSEVKSQDAMDLCEWRDSEHAEDMTFDEWREWRMGENGNS